jgi:hypothetical protein
VLPTRLRSPLQFASADVARDQAGSGNENHFGRSARLRNWYVVFSEPSKMELHSLSNKLLRPLFRAARHNDTRQIGDIGSQAGSRVLHKQQRISFASDLLLQNAIESAAGRFIVLMTR